MASDDRLGGKKTLKVNNILDDIEKDEIKKRVDIVALFVSFGVALTQKGKGFTGLCPWHGEKQPSLSVDRIKGLYHCFGCGESGDVVTLVERMKGVGFREAMDYLKKESAGGSFAPALKPAEEEKPAKQPKAEEKQKDPQAPAPRVKKLAVEDQPEVLLPDLSLAAVSDYYHKRLLTNPGALAYLKKRGLEQAELYGRFCLGYADGSLLSKVANGHREHLLSLGVLRKNEERKSVWETFKGFITFPLRDENDRVVSLYARRIDDEKEPHHLYLEGPHQGLFNGKAARVYDSLLLTESIIDAFSLLALGLDYVIPLYGTGGLTPAHWASFKENRVKTLILALNSDEAGRTA